MCVSADVGVHVCVFTDHTHHNHWPPWATNGDRSPGLCCCNRAHWAPARTDRSEQRRTPDAMTICGVMAESVVPVLVAMRAEIVPGQPHMKYSERNESQSRRTSTPETCNRYECACRTFGREYTRARVSGNNIWNAHYDCTHV